MIGLLGGWRLRHTFALQTYRVKVPVSALAGLAILSFDYWYYSNTLGSPATVKAPANFEMATGQPLQSTSGKMLLSCTVPKGDGKRSRDADENFRKLAAIYRETFGISLSFVDVTDGFRFEIKPETAEGRLKMGAVTRVVIQLHRIAADIFVTYSWEMEGLLGTVLAHVPLDPRSPEAVEAISQVEQIIGPRASGKCRII
jgi:hypothetical protein